MPSSALLFALAGVAVCGALVGVWVSGVAAAARRIIPFSGGLLVGVSLFWVLPELAGHFGWGFAGGLLCSGFGLLWVIDHFLYPVCPSCSHTHDHEVCNTRLHGFALPLLAAFALHSFIDGWSVVASEEFAGLGLPILIGVTLHKAPEGLALGVILRAALRSRGSALAWSAVVQMATPAGGLLAARVDRNLDAHWLVSLLALAGGSFLYLGLHAVHSEWKRRGAPVFMPALTGAAGAAALQLFRLAR